ncbi:aspartate carbamoyltransferase catalytic subunit [Arthrobacter sp. RIT-PI-e]|uniref:aspartate carbamoyltransferase catalytic subunit n=1 Tax=Arthrobacter sp. RIT-PI-e TaxID=1681197 RepID=UPI0009E2054B|nr:aspartate carbamoyltransferase catalytic subunit [Arthrobacter sp. RIT-PI-e]
MRHLLSTQDLSVPRALRLLDVAEEMAAVGEREIKKLPALRGRTVVNLFFEDSTRTRISFEAAAKRLSADVINFSAKGSSVSKGESLKDTAQTLEAMSADAVVIRHPSSGAPARLAASGWIDAAVVNAGDGTHEHPTQALLDAFTLRRHRARLGGEPSTGSTLAGMRILIVGDVLHSRVARSNVWLLTTLGAEVLLAGPPTLLPVGVHSWPCTVYYDLDDALARRPDAVMMLRLQAERMHAAFFPSTREYARRWGFDDARLARLDTLGLKDTVIMPPGPMNRGLEISSSAADSSRSTVLAQVRNGVSVRMAALYLLLSGDQQDDDAEDDVPAPDPRTSTPRATDLSPEGRTRDQ